MCNFLCEWQKITKDRQVLSWIAGYKIPFLTKPFQKTFTDHVYSATDRSAIQHEITSLQVTGAISKVKKSQKQFLSPVFLVDKPNGKSRFILNLKKLNKFINPPHFKLEDIRTVANLIHKDFYLASFDLKDAYFTVPIHKESKKFLRFSFNNDIWEFNCLPFGLCVAPYVFTKIMRPVIAHLRSEGVQCVAYLDDILILAPSRETCGRHVSLTLNMLLSLGFIVNFEKSNLIPSKRCKFLGFIVDSSSLHLELPLEKKEKILNTISLLKRQQKCRISQFARLIGILIAACPAVKYGWLFTKLMERAKCEALRRCNLRYSASMNIPRYVLQDLSWWSNNIPNSYNNIRFDNYKLEIFSDASTTGWGAVCNGVKSHGWWDISQSNEHINVLELMAAYYAIRIFTSDLQSCSILLRIDNITAVSCINRLGSVKHKKLHEITKLIWKWCQEKDLWAFASYIASSDNAHADSESRTICSDTEWELSNEAFDIIQNKLGIPSIDLFASNINNKCKHYVSWHQDPYSIAVDAFTIKWDKFSCFYAFPPFALVLRTLRKIVTDKAQGIVVVPYWPSQAWYPLFNQLLISPVLILGPDHSLLSCPFRKSHPLAEKLSLAAGILSARPSSSGISQKKV